jgi:hypothetical protein
MKCLLLITLKFGEKKMRCFLLNNVENLRENSGILFVNNEKMWGYFQLNNMNNLKENVGVFLLITQRT